MVSVRCSRNRLSGSRPGTCCELLLRQERAARSKQFGYSRAILGRSGRGLRRRFLLAALQRLIQVSARRTRSGGRITLHREGGGGRQNLAPFSNVLLQFASIAQSDALFFRPPA